MQLIAFIAEPFVAKRILDHLARPRLDGAAAGAGRVAQTDWVDPAPTCDVVDPVYESEPNRLWLAAVRLALASSIQPLGLRGRVARSSGTRPKVALSPTGLDQSGLRK
jgi:hypothetical protein